MPTLVYGNIISKDQSAQDRSFDNIVDLVLQWPGFELRTCIKMACGLCLHSLCPYKFMLSLSYCLMK